MSIVNKLIQVDGKDFNFKIDTEAERILNDQEFTKLAQHVNNLIMSVIYKKFQVYIPGMDASDLKQELLLLTWRSVLKFDPTRKTKFTSYMLNLAEYRVIDACNIRGKLHYIKKYKDTRPELAKIAVALLNACYIDEYVEVHGHDAPEMGRTPVYAIDYEGK